MRLSPPGLLDNTLSTRQTKLFWIGYSEPWKSMKRKEILLAKNILVINPTNHARYPVRSRQFLIPKVALLAIAVASSCFAQIGGFGGPSILSRGGAKPGQAGGQPVSFNFYAGISGSYNTGSVPLAINSDGEIGNIDLFGGTVNAGLTGSHAWRNSVLGVDYRGDFRKYSRHTYADGTEQAIDLQYTVQATRRITVHLSEIGGSSNFAYGSFISPTVALDPNLIAIPTNSIFDNRVYYFQSSASVSYRQSARMSFNFTGDGFTVHRASKLLVGVNGVRAGAQVLYQLSRRDQIGASYNFMHFDYPRAFGASDLHGVSLQYARRLRPGLQLSLGVGAFRVESLGSETVVLSPEVAAILGQTTGLQAVYRVTIFLSYRLLLITSTAVPPSAPRRMPGQHRGTESISPPDRKMQVWAIPMRVSGRLPSALTPASASIRASSRPSASTVVITAERRPVTPFPATSARHYNPMSVTL